MQLPQQPIEPPLHVTTARSTTTPPTLGSRAEGGGGCIDWESAPLEVNGQVLAQVVVQEQEVEKEKEEGLKHAGYCYFGTTTSSSRFSIAFSSLMPNGEFLR
jgi:hypothetical protein